ncbi:hypothetical protein B188_00300 [Candidatus Brocadiaceae bacterium B188]|nr:DUF4157 domain-containing protein [Candidatus Brocadia sapporoensis]RZV56607.1 MAG: DUF4157 domain-containing protein [Candidatus Brocadia sp. BROELEC01]TWU52083.1 hypothetical protein B188_00300 [Candidatus Brocadiaceae bacterium B188]
MKTTTKKSSTTTSVPAMQAANRPFFPKAGEGSFFRPRSSTIAPFVQMKMAVNKPGDKLEQEADKMAGNVMRMPSSASPVKEEKLQRQADDKLQKKEEEKIQKAAIPEEKIQKKDGDKIQKATTPEEKVQKKKDEKIQNVTAKEEKLQRKGSDGTSLVGDSTQSAIQGQTTGGQPLSSDVRNFMEPRFNADFSNVRIHNDAESAGLSNQLSARAFTYQNHIFFSRDQYQPGTSEGRQLLAHELTHTIQQGAVVLPKTELSAVHKPVVQRGAYEWIKDKIKNGLNWAADRLIPGYTLLNVILGKNLITGEPVARTGVNIIRGYMRLSPIIGSILLNELEETSTLPEAGSWVELQVVKFGINFDDLAKRIEAMWEEMSLLRGIDYNVGIFKKYIAPVLNTFLAFSTVVMVKVKELRFEGALRLVGATQLLAAMKKDPGAFKRLVEEPKLILKYFMDALKQGFSQFKNNFATHFKNALFGWLFGKAAEMGIQMPKEFNVAGIFYLVTQLLGITKQQIRTQLVKKLGPQGETIISTIEKASDIIQDVIKRGPIALWERAKSYLADLKEMIFSKIAELVSIEIIKTAVVKLISMLNPIGAIVQLVLGIYRVVKFFIDRWNTIKQITNAILDSITNVALGNISAAADYIEQTFAKGITLAIGFLASIFGLGGIVDKVKGLIKKISDPVQAAIGKVIDWVIEKGKALLGKVVGGVKAGVKSVTEWWKAKKPFTNKAGETHTLSFSGSKESAKLQISTTPVPLTTYLKQKKTENKDNPEILAKIALAEGVIKQKEIVFKQGTKTKEEKESTQLVTAALAEISQTLMDIGGGDLTAKDYPEPVISPGGVPPTESKVEKQSSAKLKKGTPTSGNHGTQGWSYIEDQKLSSLKGDKWVQMHLVSNTLGGNAVAGNLIPAPNSVNSAWRSGIEGATSSLLAKKADSAKSPASVIWLTTRVSYFGEKVSGNQFANSVSTTAGLHLYKGKKAGVADFSEKGHSVFSMSAQVPWPDFTSSDKVSLNTSSGTHLREKGGISDGIVNDIKRNRPYSHINNFEQKMLVSLKSRFPDTNSKEYKDNAKVIKAVRFNKKVVVDK